MGACFCETAAFASCFIAIFRAIWLLACLLLQQKAFNKKEAKATADMETKRKNKILVHHSCLILNAIHNWLALIATNNTRTLVA